MGDDEHKFDERSIAFLEAIWGRGHLSPGGSEEAAFLLDGIDLSGKSVVDIGSGTGGVTVSLVRDHGAGKVTGIDIEALVCDRARRLVAEAGLSDQIDIRLIDPGPLPLPNASQSIVFSKDSIMYIPDKEALAQDVFRVLRPGGWFVASDWLITQEQAPSPEMEHYLSKRLTAASMASPLRYRHALEDAGLADIAFRNRNPWYLPRARKELARLLGPERPKFEAIVGGEGLARMAETWEAGIAVLETGELCLQHFRGRKP